MLQATMTVYFHCMFEMRWRGFDMSKGKTLAAKNYMHLIVQISALLSPAAEHIMLWGHPEMI